MGRLRPLDPQVPHTILCGHGSTLIDPGPGSPGLGLSTAGSHGRAGMTDETTEPDRLWGRKKVAAVLDVSITTLWRLVRAGKFPPPLRISAGRVGWRARRVLQWIDEQDAGVRWPPGGEAG